MSKSRSKGCIYGTPICIKGVGGHGLSAYRIPLGPTRGALLRAVPEPRSGEGCTPPAQRAVTFMQHCIHNATVYRSRPPAREAGPKKGEPRSGAQPMREHAHNLCVYNAGAPATICRIDISRSVDLDSWIVDEYIFNY
jgi:hypothetical protein